jgi:hypothetical protein
MNFLKNKNKTINVTHVIILILLLIFVRIYFIKNNTLIHAFNILFVFLLLTLLFKFNLKESLIYGSVFATVYIILLYYYYLNKVETFENSEDENGENSEKKGESEIRDELEKLIKKFEADHKSGKNAINSDKLEKYTEKLKGKIELKEDDTTENEPIGVDTTEMLHDEIKPDPLKKAQKETYELIDTIGILKETVQSLNPVLSEGKKVMDLFKGLNMDGLDDNKGLDKLFEKEKALKK